MKGKSEHVVSVLYSSTAINIIVSREGRRMVAHRAKDRWMFWHFFFLFLFFSFFAGLAPSYFCFISFVSLLFVRFSFYYYFVPQCLTFFFFTTKYEFGGEKGCTTAYPRRD